MTSVARQHDPDVLEEEKDDENEVDAEQSWEQLDENMEEQSAQCLFCPSRSINPAQCFGHMKEAHAFDWCNVRRTLDLDFYGCVRLFNYARTQTLKHGRGSAMIMSSLIPGASFLTDDVFLKPILDDDALLFSFDDDLEYSAEGDDTGTAEHKTLHGPRDDDGGEGDENDDTSVQLQAMLRSMVAQNQQYKEEITQLHKAIADMKVAFQQVVSGSPSGPTSNTSINTNKKKKKKRNHKSKSSPSDSPPSVSSSSASSLSTNASSPSPSSSLTATPAPHMPRNAGYSAAAFSTRPGEFSASVHDVGYFEGYSSRRIHELMLRDQPRTTGYRDFMYNNASIFKDKVVLDVGCGTGILSMFAARAGARRVVGVDRADIIDQAKKIVEANGLAHTISLVKAKMEDAELPADVSKVDIIISEWMGYFLLYESMLPTVVYAREKWLREGGAVYPNQAVMFIAGAEANEHKKSTVDFWTDVYGFDMKCLIDDSERYQGSVVEAVDARTLITDAVALQSFDMGTVRDAQLDFVAKVQLRATRDETLQAFVVWFDVLFSQGAKNVSTLSTSPSAEDTHWHQTIFHLFKPLALRVGDAVLCEMKAVRNAQCSRSYDVSVRYALQAKGASVPQVSDYLVQEYRIE